ARFPTGATRDAKTGVLFLRRYSAVSPGGTIPPHSHSPTLICKEVAAPRLPAGYDRRCTIPPQVDPEPDCSHFLDVHPKCHRQLFAVFVTPFLRPIRSQLGQNSPINITPQMTRG